MATKSTQTHGPVCGKSFLLCLLFAMIVLVHCLLFWDYDGYPFVNQVLRKENIYSLIEESRNSTLDREDEPSSFNQNGPQNEPVGEDSTLNHEDEPSSFFNQNGPQNEPVDEDSTLNHEDKPSSFFNQNGPQNETVDEELDRCDPSKSILKVFMYDLPLEFHFGLLGWNGDGKNVWPDIRKKIPSHPGGLNLQHSIEYWLILDLLSSKFPDRSGPCAAVRVDNSSEADVVFVPFFSSLSYNRYSKIKRHEKVSRNKLLQQKLLKFLTAQKEWKRSEGRDHIIMAHHPNSMHDARSKLRFCMFILADFGRYAPHVANVEKDVIAPYKHLIKTFINDSSGFDDRPLLLYFQGAIHRKDGGSIRHDLFYLLRDEKEVHFSFGSVGANGIHMATRGMHSSKYCLNIAGDTPSSNRLFDAIASHCVPVIISDHIELPFEDVLDYSKFCIFVRTSDATKKGFLIKLIRSVSRKDWTQMWHKLKEVQGYFEFQYPSKKDDAVQMIWQAVARKLPTVRLKINQSRRFSRYALHR